MRIENRVDGNSCRIVYLLLAALLLASCGEKGQCPVCPNEGGRLPIVAAEDLDEPLEVLHGEVPPYPEEARRQGHEGSVTVLVLVNLDGTVGRSQVSIGSGYPELDNAALEASLRFRFSEPRYHRCPVRTEVLVPFRFSLHLGSTGVDSVRRPGKDPQTIGED